MKRLKALGQEHDVVVAVVEGVVDPGDETVPVLPVLLLVVEPCAEMHVEGFPHFLDLIVMP